MDRAKIRERLRRLLSVTVERGASETEAIVAAEAAARLMAEHNLSYRSVEEIEADCFGNDARPWFKGSSGRYRSAPLPPVVHCLGAIGELCGVEHSFNMYTGELAFFGAPHDTEVAHYLTVIISRAMDREWQVYRSRIMPGTARRLRASFFLGMSARISERLKAMVERHPESGTGTGLVHVKNALVKERFAAAFPGVKTRHSRMDAKNISGVRAGLEAGARVPLSKGVNEAKGALAIHARPECQTARAPKTEGE